MRELRCAGCRRLLGLTPRTQAVPAQCTDPLCATTPAASANEERDSLMEYLFRAEQQTPQQLGDAFGMTRQGAARILATR